MGSERTPDLPALRAVIAGVREHESWMREYLRGFGPRIMLELLQHAASDLTTLADACERLAEENERMRADGARWQWLAQHGAVVFDEDGGVVIVCYLRESEDEEVESNNPGPSTSMSDEVDARITPAPAGKGEG